jgi:resuscitation-promoting factor RpfA
MMLPDPPSLTPEERELAQRLGRLGPQGEPSPALDARILAAGRAAAATTPTSRRPRWPVALGLAASLVLAIGLAWRLRPLPEPPPAFRAKAVAPVERAPPQTVAESMPAAPRGQADSVEATEAARAPEPRQEPRSDAARPATEAAANPSAEPPVVFDQPESPAAAQLAAPPAPPPAPAAPEAPAAPRAFRSAAGKIAAPVTGEDRSRSAIQGAPVQPVDEASRAAAATQARDAADAAMHGDAPLDDVPPATVESPAVREAWLQRIRDLLGAGDIAGARASLHEFVHRYPAYPLPEDLRALEQ